MLKSTQKNFNEYGGRQKYKWGPVATACNRDTISVKLKWGKVIKMNSLKIDFSVLANWKDLQHGDLKWEGKLIMPSAAKPYNNKKAKKRRKLDKNYVVSNMEIDLNQSLEEYIANMETLFDN